MSYGKIKADTLVYDNGGTDVEKTVASLAASAPTADPTFTGTATFNNLTVNGTTTTINSTTLTVDDKNIVLGSVDTPTDTTADGGGITLKGATDKTITWSNSSDTWDFNQGVTVQNLLNIQNGTGIALTTSTSGDFVAKFESTDSYAAIVLEDPDSTTDGNRVQAIGDSLLLITGGTTGLTLDSSQNATFAGTVSDSKGDVRNIPRNIQASAYTLVASDAGKAIRLASGGITIPSSVMDVGEAVTIINHSSSDQTITQGSGLTMYNTADGSTGNRTLAGRGMATIWFNNDANCYISGAGLS